jgi:hypothetical protein
MEHKRIHISELQQKVLQSYKSSFSLDYLTALYQFHILTTIDYIRTYFPCLHHLPLLQWLNNGATFGSIVPQIWLQLTNNNGLVTTLNR